MSGGHFNYAQFHMESIAQEIDRLIDQNGSAGKEYLGEEDEPLYPCEIIARFKKAAHTIRQAQEMAQRIDWLVSGDDGEESFMRRWDKEIRFDFPIK